MAKITNSLDINLKHWLEGIHKIVTEGMNLKTGERSN
jgi:hypothetical protein